MLNASFSAVLQLAIIVIPFTVLLNSKLAGSAVHSGDFKRLYGCNFAENRPETIHENGRKRNMPRMSKKRKHELSFYLNDRGRVTYNELCRKCQHGCKQSFRVVVVDCPRYLSKRAKKKEEYTE